MASASLYCNATSQIFTFQEPYHDRNPPLLRQRPRRSAQLLDRTLCRTRRLGTGRPGLSMSVVDTTLIALAVLAVVARVAMLLPRPARHLRQVA